jgi:hypothetical protein
MYQARRPVLLSMTAHHGRTIVPKRLLIAIPSCLIVAALAATEAYAGNVNQHAQLLARVDH